MKSKLDTLPVIITYSDKKIDKDRLFKIFYDVIEEQEAKEERETHHDLDEEKECLSNAS